MNSDLLTHFFEQQEKIKKEQQANDLVLKELLKNYNKNFYFKISNNYEKINFDFYFAKIQETKNSKDLKNFRFSIILGDFCDNVEELISADCVYFHASNSFLSDNDLFSLMYSNEIINNKILLKEELPSDFWNLSSSSTNFSLAMPTTQTTLVDFLQDMNEKYIIPSLSKFDFSEIFTQINLDKELLNKKVSDNFIKKHQLLFTNLITSLHCPASHLTNFNIEDLKDLIDLHQYYKAQADCFNLNDILPIKKKSNKNKI